MVSAASNTGPETRSQRRSVGCGREGAHGSVPRVAERGRDPVVTALAVAMALLAVSNLSKPVTQRLDPEHAGFVFLGTRLHGAANAVAGPLFGAVLAAYAWGAWTMRRWVLPLALAYAVWVPVNLLLFARREGSGGAGAAFLLAYAVVAVGVSSGGALWLHRERERLR